MGVKHWASHIHPRHTVIKDLKPHGEPEYHNHDPLVRLMWETKYQEVEVDSITYDGLLDGASQMTTITERLRLGQGLPLHPIENILNIEGSRGTLVPYLGYVETHFKNPYPKVCNGFSDARCSQQQIWAIGYQFMWVPKIWKGLFLAVSVEEILKPQWKVETHICHLLYCI